MKNLFRWLTKKLSMIILSLTVSGLPMGMVMADATVKFHGTLIATTCSADAVDVDFGEVQVNSIIPIGSTLRTEQVRAGGSSSKSFEVNITCTGNVTSDIQYQVKGATASFMNNAALATNIPGLAINLSTLETNSKNTVIDIGTWYTFPTSAGSRTWKAMLFRDRNTTFAGGDFSATATITIQLP